MNTDPDQHQPSAPAPGSDHRLMLVGKIIGMLKKEYSDFIDERCSPNQKRLAHLAERAELLLDVADNHIERRVHAYQLFEPSGPMLSARDIASRFEEAEWTQEGMSHVSLREKFKELLGHAEREIAARSETFSGVLMEGPQGHLSIDEFIQRLDDEVIALLERLGLPDIVRDPEGLGKAVVASIEKLIDAQLRNSHRRGIDEAEACLAVHHFMEFVCGARTVADYQAGDTKLVRPYELFLFASQHGHMEGKLTIGAHKLSPGVKLQASVRSSLSILETHGGADTAVEAWLRQYDPNFESQARE